MKKYLHILQLFSILTLWLSFQTIGFAKSYCCCSGKSPVQERVQKEEKIPPCYTAIAFHRPNYGFPYYYTGSPADSAYNGQTPNNERLKHGEVKYQISLKVPVWKNILGCSSLYFAYTQLSYWQLYNQRAFFRETDYEPELFLVTPWRRHLFGCWNLDFFNVGVSHQSNGDGNQLQRGWDRIFFEVIGSTDNWMASLRPWYITSTNKHNRNIASYMGYAKFLVAYKCHQQVFAVQFYNVVESGGRRPSAEATWSFPLNKYFKGYVQLFSGYGQSLIEYNHHTNSAGIGLALNDYI